MEAHKNNIIARSIRISDIQKSLDFFTKTLGFQASDKLTRKNGSIVHDSVGMDSPLLMLTPNMVELANRPLGTGVEFHLGMNGLKRPNAFIGELKAKGITVMNLPDECNDDC